MVDNLIVNKYIGLHGILRNQVINITYFKLVINEKITSATLTKKFEP